MHDLIYYRKLYEYEIHHGHLNKIKNYISHRKIDIIQDFHRGRLHIPSPFLLDEIEWEIDAENDKAQTILYKLKIISRKFYTSLIDYNSQNKDNAGPDVYLSLGYKFINCLIELKSYNKAGYHTGLPLLKTNIFSTLFSKSAKALATPRKTLLIWWLIAVSSLTIVLDFAPPAITLLLMSLTGIAAAAGTLVFKNNFNFKEKDLFAGHYTKLLTMLKNHPHLTMSDINIRTSANIEKIKIYKD